MENFNNNVENNEEIEIDLSRLFTEIRKKIKFIILVGIIGGAIAFTFTNFFISKKYESSARIYLKPNTTETGSIDYNALNANSKMVNNYMLMIQGDSILDKVTKTLKLEDKGENFVKESLSVTNETDSEIIKVTARTEDSELSKDIVSAVVDQFFSDVKAKLDVKNLMIIDQAKVEETPVSPNKKINTALGIIAGIAVSGGIVVLRFLLDKRMHTKEDVESYLEIPVLAEIPYYED
ncbi:Wzz/FepE/Etk N-terminal domain-containing protein [Erysipelotrichaceae bacterium HCN-30851]